MEENNYIVFKKQYGNIKRPRTKEVSINQNGVKIYEKDQSMIINIVLPIEDSMKVYQFFEEFNLGEDIQFNISNTGDFECVFRGISSVIDKDSYSSFSITVQEKYQRPDQLQVEADCNQVDEYGNPIQQCIGCGLHRDEI
ncbi:hypothetical protein mru_1752 [Methanobrevibacter ruminantium M1]|uniref:Uncharacterized protein n=1 Tax=Methanobrevibacter ruminantium (strain ATCC 35063 / DSM 1093 / JCM 13430 / OCM 146 / M1) TaxID=634498 RepID=D3DZ52_METRM|nr:hypothetical protein [Methanobrevibacter ruminantium]ADC47602.1 hypothetical protein mru_1752 [Methanobrevibacter ruminantium M1]